MEDSAFTERAAGTMSEVKHTRLTDMEFDEVSLVDNPAEPNARVVLYKRHEEDALKKGDGPSGDSVHVDAPLGSRDEDKKKRKKRLKEMMEKGAGDPSLYGSDRKKRKKVKKHHGPGNHPSGSPQSAHGTKVRGGPRQREVSSFDPEFRQGIEELRAWLKQRDRQEIKGFATRVLEDAASEKRMKKSIFSGLGGGTSSGGSSGFGGTTTRRRKKKEKKKNPLEVRSSRETSRGASRRTSAVRSANALSSAQGREKERQKRLTSLGKSLMTVGVPGMDLHRLWEIAQDTKPNKGSTKGQAVHDGAAPGSKTHSHSAPKKDGRQTDASLSPSTINQTMGVGNPGNATHQMMLQSRKQRNSGALSNGSAGRETLASIYGLKKLYEEVQKVDS